MSPTVYLLDDLDALGSETVERALPTLPPERRERAERCVHAGDRARIVAAWLLLAHGLRAEYGLPDVPPLAYGERGKPYFAQAVGNAAPLPQFSLSHSGQLVACALASADVGLDVQEVAGVTRRLSDGFVRRTCSPEEIAVLGDAGSLGSTAFAQAFCALWTRKESVIKLTGRGLAEPLPDLLSRHERDVATTTLALDGPDASPNTGFLSLSLWRDGSPLRSTAPAHPGSSFRLVRISPGELLARQ
ncbi:MAG: 4'-phosphopantetheinyl transferase superfamily protein [Coriobacteriia bacterium]|nr:4'-phosphopantetheinyl transferase superfamily protein [Coriobacteriia bacterium]